jgi:hypothetical protein
MGLKLTPLMTRSLIGRRAEISSEDAWDTSKEAILLNLATKFAALSEVIEPFSMCLTDPETGVADNPVLGLVAQQVLEHLLRAHEELGYFGRIVYNMPWKTASPEGDAANKNVNRFEQSQGDPVQSAVTAVSALPTPSLADTVQQRRGELLTAIAEKTTEIEEAEIALHGLVGEARTLKVPWREIGAVVGVTPQAAMRRFDETAREKHNEYQRQARARS